MKTVTQKFLDDVNAGLSPAIRYKIWLKNENDEEWDITDLASRKKLFRIDWQLEGKLTAFRQGDTSLSIVYDAALWDWIQDSEEIKVYVDGGFDYEKVNSFRGYIDKENTEHDTRGLIHIRAYPIHKALETIKISEVPSPTLNPSLVKDAVSAIFTKAGVTEQDIRVLPIDTKDNKYIDNYLDITQFGGAFAKHCPVSDRAFLFSGEGTGLLRIEFSEDWSDYTETVVTLDVGYQCIRIDKWRDDYYVAVYGRLRQKYFYNGAIPVSDWDMVDTKIIICKADGTLLYNFDPPNFTQFSITFYPRAYMVSPLWDERTGTPYFLIGYNGVHSSDYWVRYCAVRMFDMSTPTTPFRTFIYYFRMFHVFFWLCGGGQGWAWVYPMKIGTYGATGQTIYALKSIDGSYWVHYTRVTAVNPDSFYARGAWPLGRFVLFGNNTSAFDYQIMDGVLNFLPSGFTDIIAGTNTNFTDLGVPKQVIAAYGESGRQIYIRKYFNDNLYTNETLSETLRQFQYYDGSTWQTWNMQFDAGFKYWNEYNDKSVYLGIPRFYLITGDAGHICIFAPRMLPFMSLWGADEANDGILTTLEKIAQAFNCLFNFTDFDTGWFYSRDYVGAEWTITKDNPYKFQDISKDVIYEILIKWNGNETLIGSGTKRITIETPYLPAHEVAVETIGQKYYDFFSTYRWLIKVKTDYLIFLELFDFAHLWDAYSGWIFDTSQEHNRYRLKMRARLGTARGGT